MKLVNRGLSEDMICKIEEQYKAEYVMDTCLKTHDGQWTNWYGCIFYTKEPHPKGSNYFALFKDELEGWKITNGLSAIEGEFNGILFEDGELIHSRFRHDCFVHREAMVDGGRDYVRTGGIPADARPIKFKVVGPDLVLCVV